MARIFLAIAAIYGGLAVAGGAFASHALQGHLPERALAVFQTGIRYQMSHALALLLVAVLLRMGSANGPWLTVAGWGFISGVVLFSGSLYLISLAGLKVLGPVTPLGGLAFLIGWGSLAIAALTLPPPP
jgi:uncharacterized membrane protein YgdD (TMEM256/DUF423 family)